MKLCKVKLVRIYSIHSNHTRCRNIFPKGYHRDNIEIIAYEECPLVEGNNVGYCIGNVVDDFTFTDDMVEITKKHGEAFIAEVAALQSLPEHGIKFNAIKKRMLTNAGIV